jgi:hypothetical protein
MDHKQDVENEMSNKILDDIFKIIPKKKFTDLIEITVQNIMCGFKTCNVELMQLNKIKVKNDNKILKLTKKFQDKIITKEKYEAELKKINTSLLKTKENLKFIECSLSNCFEFIKKQLLISIDIQMITFKDNKEKINKLKAYYKLFNKKTIDIKDVKRFYNEL